MHWIRRADHEAAIARERQHALDWRAVSEEYRDQLKEQREANRALVQQIVDLKHAGYEKAPEQRSLPDLPDLTPTDYAIESRVESAPSVQRAKLRRYLLTYRDGQKAKGIQEDVIASAIERWSSEEDDG